MSGPKTMTTPRKLAGALCCLTTLCPVTGAAQPSAIRTHEFSGSAFAVSHGGTDIALLKEDLCIYTLLSDDGQERCFELDQPPRDAAWSLSDARLAVSTPLAGNVNDAVWTIDLTQSDAEARPRRIYESSTAGPGVTYARVERWLSDRLLVVNDNRGRKLLLDARDGAVVTSCVSVSVQGSVSFVGSQRRWIGMGHSGRLIEIELVDRDGELTLTCNLRDHAAPGTWLRFEDAFPDGRLLLSEQIFDRGTRHSLGADVLVTNRDIGILDRLTIGSPLSVDPQGNLVASIRVDESGIAYLTITESGHQQRSEFMLSNYETSALVGDFAYERFTPSWSPGGDYVLVLVPTGIVRGGLPSASLRLVSLEDAAVIPVLEEVSGLEKPVWISDARFAVQSRNGIAGARSEIWVYQIVP